MSWPQAQEYNEAIQNPNTAFLDADLRRGTVKTNKLGLPQAISGGFASVYQITTPTGTWAVRCFIREVTDGHRRYEEISKALNSMKLPYTAPFEFQRQGIRVGGQTLPIVKMQWMRGDLLNDYVAANLQNPKLIADLAKKWAAMVSELKVRKVAHCDLQHGNVLVVNHELKLIDYDGMFVPAFNGLKANEQGHPNYQHPKRTDTDFGPFTDHFSAWVIYTALRVLAVTPELYALSRALGRDDCLLFNRDDFASPSTSQIFSELRTSGDAGVVRLAQHLTSLISQSPQRVPALDPTPFGEPVIASVSTTAGSNEWWRDHIQDNEPPPNPIKVEPVTLSASPKAQKEILYFIAGSFAAFCGCYLTGALGVVGYIVAQFAIFWGAKVRLEGHFKECPEGAARIRFDQEIFLREEDLTGKQKRLDQNQETIADRETRRDDLSNKLQVDITAVTTEQGEEMRKIYEQQAVANSQINLKRKSLIDEEARALSTATDSLENELRSIQSQIASVGNKRAQMLADALVQLRTTMLTNFLNQHSVSSEQFYGISYRYKQNLIYEGIRTAADVSFGRVSRVDGFGPKRTETILSWRKNLENQYTGRLPSTLPPSEAQRVEQSIQAKRTALEAALQVVWQKVTGARRQVESAFSNRKAALSGEENQINASTQQRIASVTTIRENKISYLRTRFESSKRELEREIATSRALVGSLKSDIARSEAWLRDVAGPTKEAYKYVMFSRFVYTVLTSKYQS